MKWRRIGLAAWKATLISAAGFLIYVFNIHIDTLILRWVWRSALPLVAIDEVLKLPYYKNDNYVISLVIGGWGMWVFTLYLVEARQDREK
jgi:hypothetical protein